MESGVQRMGFAVFPHGSDHCVSGDEPLEIIQQQRDDDGFRG